MPPWSSRLLPPNTRGDVGSTSAGASSAGPSRVRGPPMITEADILESAYGIPTLQPPPRKQTSHGRSMSHPFPSLFSGRKKRGGVGAPIPGGFESTDDDSGHSGPGTVNIPSSVGQKQTKVPDKDLRVGKCMTCDSQVRWPKELKTFRCSICLMVNDLKPAVLDGKRGNEHRPNGAARAGTYPGNIHSPKAESLSLEKTRQLIDQCITSYLLERMKHNDDHTSSPSPFSPLSQNGKSRDVGPGARNNNTLYPDKRNVQFYQPTLPIDVESPYSSRPRNDGQDLGRSLPYSTSFPGSFSGVQLVHREKELPPLPSEGLKVVSISKGRRPSQTQALEEGFPFENHGDHGQEQNNTKTLFKPLEDYLTVSFGSLDCINRSFVPKRPVLPPRTASEGTKRVPTFSVLEIPSQSETQLSELDAKTLLLGDFAENGSWWTGDRPNVRQPERSRTHRRAGDSIDEPPGLVTLKSPRIEWAEVNEWYRLVTQTAWKWQRKYDDLLASDEEASELRRPSIQEMEEMGDCFADAQFHVQRVLLKVTESLLKRPGRPLTDPEDLRFLLVILANPLLYSSRSAPRPQERSRSRSRSRDRRLPAGLHPTMETGKRSIPLPPSNTNKGSSGQHSVIIKRILGLMSNMSNECHHHLVNWFARFSDEQFQRTADLIGSFVTYRLTRQQGKKRETNQDPTAGLIPSLSGPGRNTSAALHAALGASASSGQSAKKKEKKLEPVVYNDDWQIKAAAKVMSLMFKANNSSQVRRPDARQVGAFQAGHNAGLAAREKAHSHGQIIAISDFYNTLLDYSDLVADFEAWESGRGKFSFCQYPFFLSIWAKIQIMEHDAKRQMEIKAREAFFDSIMTHKTVNQYLVLKVRRECLVEDSLKGVSEVVGGGGEEIKKGLRIEFKGEEGIDAGGLRKEWFLLLVRDVFNPEHGMFTYDDDSRFCYFNPNSFETTDQFFLVGVVLGLAIYNSTILDVALPPFAFRKLLAAGPTPAPGATSHAKPSMTYTLEDLAEFRPALANGLRKLLEFDGDVENTFCRDFVADVERYGQAVQVPLCPDGENKPVTNANKREFVDLYVRYLLDTSVVRQFEPFKRGFFTVCGGNALSLFRPEEIELLIRGSDEPLDINSLRAVAKYENWKVSNAPATEPVISWFWSSFEAANPKDQRKMLSFITGSDRIPATGAATMVIKLSCLGDDSPRFPVARTCFNMLSLYKYSSREKLESMLWRSVYESEGFGLK